MDLEFQVQSLPPPWFSSKEPYSLETRLSELGLRRGDKGMKARDHPC